MTDKIQDYMKTQKRVKLTALRKDEVKKSLPVEKVLEGKPNNGQYFVFDKVVD